MTGVTQILKVDAADPEASRSELEQAARALLQGENVAFPTETVYGLGALWRLPEAVDAIFRIKGRPHDNPLILHVACPDDAWELARSVTPEASALAEAFWPGPLTLILPAIDEIPAAVTAGLDTVGLRCPSHPVAHALLACVGEAVAAPSANLSGRPSPTRCEDVAEDLDGRVPIIVDGGDSEVGLESTIISVTTPGVAEILRPGGISAAMIRQAFRKAGLNSRLLGDDASFGVHLLEADEAPRAPGMKYRHYAPRAKVCRLTSTDPETQWAELMAYLDGASGASASYGLFIRDDLGAKLSRQGIPASVQHMLTFPVDDEGRQAAHALFAAFRLFDRIGCDTILVSSIPPAGYGTAFMNRLLKACSPDAPLPPTDS